MDGQLVAVDRGDVAVSEFEVEHAVADREGRRSPGRARDELALDGKRRGASRAPTEASATAAQPAGWHAVVDEVGLRFLLEAAAAPLRALPAGGAVARAEMGRLVEAGGPIAAIAAEAAARFGHLDVGLGQFVEEAGG